MSRINYNVFAFLSILFFFSLIKNTNAQIISQPNEILLESERIILPENIQTLDWKNEIVQGETVNGNVYRLVQFDEMPTPALHQRIKDAGIALLDYIPNKAYITSIPKNISTSKLKVLNIRSIFHINKKWKQSDDVRYQSFGDWATNKGWIDLSVRYHKNISKEKIVSKFEQQGIEILKAPDFIHIVQIRVEISDIDYIIDLPYVSYVDQITDPGSPEDNLGRGLHRTNMIDTDYPSGRHYNGEGVKILVRDDGDVGPHIDFHGRLNQNNTDFIGTHGDGVAGLAGGAGNLDPRYRGMATGSEVYVRQYEADFLDETIDLHQNEGVVLTNSSFSNGCNAGYTSITETVDFQTHQNQTLMHIFSAGNSNNQDCGYGAGDQWGNITGGHKQGKNVIATANLFADGTLVNSSSRGPAHDGRIKPDIAANGANQMSTDPNNTYDPFGGTSAAAPCVMGTSAQLYQAYRELSGGNTPESSLIKATLLNTANDLGNPGPDFRFGWGHLNAYRAVKLLEEERFLDGMVDQGGFPQHTINIPAGTKQVRFMLYWMDEAAAPFSAIALVNNLDLTVQDPAMNNLMPWVLDPTPDPSTLDNPAGNGVDNLNNMEQVLINSPQEGDYILSVEGTIVPNGAIKYYIVYEVISDDDITLTYPNGGEGFVSGEDERIHWDAIGDNGNFLVEYSSDNGTSWNTIATTPGNSRMVDWQVPNIQTGHVQVRVTRDGVSDATDANLSIGAVPQNVNIAAACPDYVRVNWDMVAGATGYDVFRLGEKYMDSVATTTDLFFDVPITNPNDENWFAVRARGDENFVGRRTIAIPHNDGLLNCAVDFDVANNAILSPAQGLSFVCDNSVQDVTMVFQNNGLNDVVGVNLYYQLDNNPPVMESYTSNISPFVDVTYTFATPLTISASGNYTLKSWVEFVDDQIAFNDTLETSFSVSVAATPIIPDFVETFESGTFPPMNWNIFNLDNDDTWESADVIGSDGNLTTAAFMNNYFYNASSQEDELISFPIDLSNMSAPVLSFDLSYTPFNTTNWADSMRVDVFLDCGNQYDSTVYYKFGLDLATVPDPSTNVWEPSSGDDWRNEVIDLSAYTDQVIIVKFININGYGNSLYLDNINFFNASAAPEAVLSSSATEICVDEPVTFQQSSSGFQNDYTWDFGDGASVATGTGDGPFTITYSTPGTKTISLTATNANGADTDTKQIEVVPGPAPSFTYTIDNGVVTFTNTSTNASSYFWDFGNATSSGDENPTVTYTTSGEYTVTLNGISTMCGNASYSETITVIITSIEDHELDIDAAIIPNPNNGIFNLSISDNTSRELDVELIDLTGRIIDTWTFRSNQGNTVQPIGRNDLTASVYFIKIRNEDAVKILKVVVQ